MDEMEDGRLEMAMTRRWRISGVGRGTCRAGAPVHPTMARA
jgi:hypothetical protein